MSIKDVLKAEMEKNDFTMNERIGIKAESISFEKENTTIRIEMIKHRLTIYAMLYTKGEELLTEKQWDLVVQCMEEKAKRYNKVLIFDDISHWEEFLKGKQYKELSKDDVKQLAHAENEKEKTGYVQEQNLIQLQDDVSFIYSLKTLLKEYEENEMLFLYEEDEEEYDKYWFRCAEFVATLVLEKEEKGYSVRIFKEEVEYKKWSFSSAEQMKETVLNYLTLIEKKERLNSLFSPSTYFFDLYCRYAVIDFPMKKEVYKKLREFYTPYEIEQISSMMARSRKQVIWFKVEYEGIMEFGSKIIYIEKSRKEVLLFDQHEQVKEEIRKHMMKAAENEINEKFKKWE